MRVSLSPAIPDMRCTVRFPLHLPIQVHGRAAAALSQTTDISAGGVLFEVPSQMEVGSQIEFTICMPASRIGAQQDVLVNCVGRVVRCSSNGEQCAVAAVIDDYRFVRE